MSADTYDSRLFARHSKVWSWDLDRHGKSHEHWFCTATELDVSLIDGTGTITVDAHRQDAFEDYLRDVRAGERLRLRVEFDVDPRRGESYTRVSMCFLIDEDALAELLEQNPRPSYWSDIPIRWLNAELSRRSD